MATDEKVDSTISFHFYLIITIWSLWQLTKKYSPDVSKYFDLHIYEPWILKATDEKTAIGHDVWKYFNLYIHM